jgi:fumarylpyruvate hydrolase
MTYVFPPTAPVTVAVAHGPELFPVRRVFCVGRNYAAHAREMGFDPEREPPFFFCKPADAIRPVPQGQTLALPYPTLTDNLHYEVELVVAIGTAGRHIAREQALNHVWGYAVGLDMTRRDLQIRMRDMGRPWEIGKAFDASAPIGPLYPVTAVGHIQEAPIWLKVNGQSQQNSNVSQLIWSVAEIIADLSTYFQLAPGDLIYTGTPEGVGPVIKGDLMLAGIQGLGEIAVQISSGE